MSCPFVNGEQIVAVTIKPTLRPDPTIGARIFIYDQTFLWTDEHLAPTQLNEWRTHGDPLIDAFFQQHGEQFQDGDDTYEILKQSNDEIRQRPIWFNREQIQRGQHFFLKNSSIALTSIFHYTLLIGYGFQQLNDVLMKTQYVSSTDLSLSHRRLVETLQMITTAVCGDVDDFEQTFADVLRVRLLHGMLRYKLLKQQHTLAPHIPINQEDLLITLLGFSFSVLYCMEERMHMPISDDDKHAYLHLWRYIGWVIGIDDDHLIYLSSYRLARVISESIFYHFYLPSPTSRHLVHHSLIAVYTHTIAPMSLHFYLGVTQFLMGDGFSRALDIDQPHVDALHVYAIRLLFQLFRFTRWLANLDNATVSRWIIKRSRQRLIYVVSTVLNNQLCNFARFRSYEASSRTSQLGPLRDCPCGYYQKKQHGMIKTHDIGLFRVRHPVPFLRHSLLLFALAIVIRCCTAMLS